MSNIATFQYELTDFCYKVQNDKCKSKFDEIIEEKWKEGEEKGIFRYKLNISEWKRLEGPFKFLAQLNLDRATKRRRPEDICSMSQPFDPDRFNFTKIPEKEIILDLTNGTGNDVLAFNISPIEWGHYLFLPDRLKCLPQKMTETSLQRALELLLLSNSQYFRVIFNSLCAYASVNHLHWHIYYLKHEMFLEDSDLDEIKSPLFAIKNYPAKGFCLKLSSFSDGDLRKLGSWTYFVINYLQENEIAHNVYLTRAKINSSNKTHDDIRVYIWARKPSIGVKDPQALVPAVSELFGHLIIRTEECYKNLSEESVAQLLNEVTEDVFTGIKADLEEKIANKLRTENK